MEQILNDHNKQEYPSIYIRGLNTTFAGDNIRSFILIILFIGLNITYCNAQITYKIQTKLFSRDVLDSYPQKIIAAELKDSIYSITLQIFAVNHDSTKFAIVTGDSVDINYLYPTEISPFLQSTALINHQLPKIKYIADTLFGNEKNTMEIIKRGLKFASSYITSFDDSLALEIDKGNCFTFDLPTILKRKKGTCSEYTNLFISLMRSKGIPCRFITGYVSYPPQNIAGSHAWAECYIKNYGWLSVNPQRGQLAYPILIKLFAGKDYKDCNIKLLENITPLSIEIIDNKYQFN